MKDKEYEKTIMQNPVYESGNRIPISKMQAYINELVAENKALKEQNTILQNQNKDLLVSMERLKP